MNKKIVALCLCVAILASALTAGTLAWLTDKDSARNTMTVGNVKIEQIEQQREVNDDGNYTGKLVDFDQDKKLLPAVYSDADAAIGGLQYDPQFAIPVGGALYNAWNEKYNAVDKIVTVKNTGTEDAYIRTIIAFEDDNNASDMIHFGAFADANSDKVPSNGYEVDVNGKHYEVYVFTYWKALEADQTSTPSLKQIYLDREATNDWYDKIADIVVGEDGTQTTEYKYDILVLSQAAQTAGFTYAEEALNAAFGEINVTNLEAWLADVQ